MALFDSTLWAEDVSIVARGAETDLAMLGGSTILITGATGLLCSGLVDLIAAGNEELGLGVRVQVAEPWSSIVDRRFGKYVGKPWFEWVPYDATDLTGSYLPASDYIVHGASIASPDSIVARPVETLLSNFVGLDRLLKHAKNCDAKVLYVSSSEVYGACPGPHREDEYGPVDPLGARAAYPEGKRSSEALLSAYVAEYMVRALIVRPGHVYGPTASNTDVRVGSAWAWAAAKGEDIVMKSSGAQVRSYVHCLDCATALLRVLLAGNEGRAYNISNPLSIISLRELAKLLSEAGGVRVIHEEAAAAERKAFNPMMDSSLDSSSLESLGWQGLFDARQGTRRTVETIREAFLGGEVIGV